MKLNRIVVVLLMLLPLVVGSWGQAGYSFQRRNPNRNAPRHPVGPAGVAPNPQSLSALQNDLSTAIQYMEAALPIYDGNRIKSIHAAHRALALVDKAINANAAPRNMSKAKDHIPSGSAKGRYNNESIAQSQTNMRQGLSFLTAAQKDLQGAAGSNPNKQAFEVQKLIGKAVTEANTAINLHSSQG
ncbi:MAG TPA: hypothetical protein VKT78_20825 [Fimbriimonadaceae bacterium]|nr:hypothetical protein [Fimbriimonadaceae bacterium]